MNASANPKLMTPPAKSGAHEPRLYRIVATRIQELIQEEKIVMEDMDENS